MKRSCIRRSRKQIIHFLLKLFPVSLFLHFFIIFASFLFIYTFASLHYSHAAFKVSFPLTQIPSFLDLPFKLFISLILSILSILSFRYLSSYKTLTSSRLYFLFQSPWISCHSRGVFIYQKFIDNFSIIATDNC